MKITKTKDRDMKVSCVTAEQINVFYHLNFGMAGSVT